jgi:hypothetical protein
MTAGTGYIQFPDGTQQFTASTTSPNLLNTNNTWTGTNTFNNTITAGADKNIVMTAGTGYIQFPNSTQQTTAYIPVSPALTTGAYAYPSSVSVNGAGQITAITAGTTPATPTSITNFYQVPTQFNTPLIITPPTNCVKFDCRVIGTGGLAGSNWQYQGGGLGDRWYLGGAGGGGGVSTLTNIGLPKQGTITGTNGAPVFYVYNANGGPGGYTALFYYPQGASGSGEIYLAYAGNGQNGTDATGFGSGVGGTGNTLSYVNYLWGTFSSFFGDTGQNGQDTLGLQISQVGGGNFYGGVAGYPTYPFGANGSPNTNGQGQGYSAYTIGNNSPIPASPINYGGVFFTWYII